MTEQERMERCMQIRNELFDLANSFAGDRTGDIAVGLHQACNFIFWANEALDHIHEAEKGKSK